MPSMGMKGTKWNIFTTSIEMFAEKNYYVVSLRDIAKNVGIKASSIYNHFESKEELLDQILEYFEYHFNKSRPDLGELLVRAEKEEPRELLTQSVVRFDKEVEPIMGNIMKIAINEMRTNERAKKLINNYFIETPGVYTRTILNRMMETGRIKPVDSELMAMLMSSYCFATALRVDVEEVKDSWEWENGFRKIFQLVEPIEQYAEMDAASAV